ERVQRPDFASFFGDEVTAQTRDRTRELDRLGEPFSRLASDQNPRFSAQPEGEDLASSNCEIRARNGGAPPPNGFLVRLRFAERPTCSACHPRRRRARRRARRKERRHDFAESTPERLLAEYHDG